MKLPRLLLRPPVLYGAFAFAAFLLALRWTFPSEAVKERLIYEAGKLGWQIDVQRVGPTGVLGVRMSGVSLTDSSGLKIPVERLEASLRVLPLVIGRRVLDYRASLYGGEIEGRADLSGRSRRMALQIEGVELSQALPLTQAAGMGIAGRVTGTLDLVLPEGAVERSTGALELSIAKAGLGGGPVPMPPLGNLTLPPIDLGDVSARATVDQGRLNVKTFEARGGDTELTGENIVLVLQSRLQYAPLAGEARLRVQPSLWQKPAAATLRPVVEAGLASSKTPDGSYRFLLAGSLGHPSIRPAGPGGTASTPPPPGGPDVE